VTPGQRARRVVVGLALVALLWPLAELRQAAIDAIVRNDAPPGAGPDLPQRPGTGLSVAPQVRVVLIDGAGASTARTMPIWSALCDRGLDLAVDVGFPTVSLPVELALWSGRTQQQTGVLYHSTGTPVAVPAVGIPGLVPGSVAVAESHAYIVHSLGFAQTAPPLDGKKLPAGWADRWVGEATAAVAGPAPLVFVHVLRVDSAGHKYGRRSAQWRAAAASSDVILAGLLAAAPDARWFVLADHDHLATGGHGGEDRAIRVVRGCIAGPGLAPRRGGPIAMIDVARALADSVGVTLAPDAKGRPLEAALAAPVTDDEMLPDLPNDRQALALFLLSLGIAATAWGTRGRVRAAPWWWPVAIASLMLLAMTPSLSTPMIYKREGLTMANGFAPGLAVLAIALTLEIRRDCWRALVAQLALPVSATLGCWVLTGAAPILWGATVCPVVPFYTGWLPPLTMITATALAVAGLVVLASAVLPGSGPSARRETSRSDRAAP